MASSDRIVPVLALLVWTACATTASPPERPRVLQTLDGRHVSIEELTARHEATVLVWWSSTCPCVRRYEDRIRHLRAHYPADKVSVWLVASNTEESPEALARTLAARGMDVPVLLDPGAHLARSLGAGSTPAAVVLDRDGHPLFRGWIDNERDHGTRGREPYVENVLDAVLAGRADFTGSSPAYGCPIPRSLREPNREPCMAPAAELAEGNHHVR